MSRSTPVCLLKCVKCRAKAPFSERFGDAPRSYINVKVVGERNAKPLCRCGTCGYEYVSTSTAAHRGLDRLKTYESKKKGHQ